jgi:hypothetical protein
MVPNKMDRTMESPVLEAKISSAIEQFQNRIDIRRNLKLRPGYRPYGFLNFFDPFGIYFCALAMLFLYTNDSAAYRTLDKHDPARGTDRNFHHGFKKSIPAFEALRCSHVLCPSIMSM